MTKLSRQPDGSYSGTYKGHEFTVRKEEITERIGPTYTRTETVWIARSGTFEHRANGSRPTREEAVQGLIRELDMAAVNVPEVDALLKRWTEEIKAIVPLLNDRDTGARIQLQSLRGELASFEALARLKAVHFEESLAELKARMQQAPERAAIA